MVEVGLLHNHSRPEKVKKAYAFQAVALMEGIHFFCFTYGDVDVEMEKINGWVYQGEWVRVERNFPDIVINSCSAKTKIHKKIRNKLKEKSIFTSHYVGHKMKVYKKILKGVTFADYLIPSFPVRDGLDVLAFLEDKPRGVFKSYRGNQGKKVFFLEKAGAIYMVKKGVEEQRFDKEGIVSFIENLIVKEKWLIQPYIQARTKNGRSYDFRLHMQKNGLGDWEITLIYPRLSSGERLNSNISSGGSRVELIPFLRKEFPNSWTLVMEKLEVFSLEFTKHFENLYKRPFDELGIDVGLDQDGKLWIFEVNSRPGCKQREFEVAKRHLAYCRYLASKREQNT